MIKELNVKKIVVVCFIFLPLLFYSIPYVSSLKTGYLKLHFFKSFNVPSSLFLICTIAYFSLGLSIFFSLKKTQFKIRYQVSNNPAVDLITVILFATQFLINVGYIKVFIVPMFILIIASYRPRNFTFVLLFLVAFVQMVISYDRYPIILVLLIWSLPILANFSYKKLFLSALFAIIGLVFILQPIRAGMLPFTGKMSGLIYLYQHMSPIYIGAHLQYEKDFGVLQLLAESIPFAKSILGYDTAINIIAEDGLPRHIINMGIRHGSNTTMYFSNLGGIIILAIMNLTLYIMVRIIKIRFFYNALLMMFILQGPYFIRRTFGALFIDIIVCIFICLVFSFIQQLIAGQRNINHRPNVHSLSNFTNEIS